MKYHNPISALNYVGGSLTIHFCMTIWATWIIVSDYQVLKDRDEFRLKFFDDGNV